MAHSRLEKIGTIYSRITGLIKSGAMKLEDRPLWYEVYQAFPPKYPPMFNRPFEDKPIREILYPEDVIRAKFYKRMKNAPVTNLTDSEHQTPSQKFIQMCLSLQKENNLTLDEAFEKAISTLTATTEEKSNIPGKESEANTSEKISINVKDIFK